MRIRAALLRMGFWAVFDSIGLIKEPERMVWVSFQPLYLGLGLARGRGPKP